MNVQAVWLSPQPGTEFQEAPERLSERFVMAAIAKDDADAQAAAASRIRGYKVQGPAVRLELEEILEIDSFQDQRLEAKLEEAKSSNSRSSVLSKGQIHQ